jgi:predicted DCC family thiol-disulfide oxidoreductase YuxK
LKKIIYFDGVCNLCNWAVRLIIKYDKRKVFSFASLQSNYARDHLVYGNGQDIKFDSVVYQEDHIVLIRSEAVLRICKHLGGVWSLLYIFRVVPIKWRDWLYDIVAGNRYQWFGKRDQCMIPTPELQSRFLD